jgi:hypothetical protein
MADFYLDYRGNDYNGGGYDASISGATVNLASGEYAALTASGLECVAGTTEITSVHGGFTTDMIGNAIQIYGGDNWTFGYYFISGVPDSNTVLVDSSPATTNAVSGIGKVGGAWLTFINTKRDTANTHYPVLGKMVGGDTIYVKGNGEWNPETPQYNVQYGYMQKRIGDANNLIKVIGYNGRPYHKFLGSNLGFYQDDYTHWENIKFKCVKGEYETSHSVINGGYWTFVNNCTFCQDDSLGLAVMGHVQNCYFYNSVPSTGTFGGACVRDVQYNTLIIDNVFENWNGIGVQIGQMGTVENNIFIADGGTYNTAIRLPSANTSYGRNVKGNTIYNYATGIKLDGDTNETMVGNLFVGCGTGIWNYGTVTKHQSRKEKTVDYNAFYNTNTTHYNINSGVNDVYLTADPFLNSGIGDYTLNNIAGGGKECRGAYTFKNNGYSKANNYRDIGAFQAYDK